MQRIPYEALYGEFRGALLRAGVPEERAAVVARLFADNQRDGVFSHGLNRFPWFLAQIRAGKIDLQADPARVGGRGGIEQWDGKMGIGPWNAHLAIGRAIELARAHGLGCVAMRNTNHWMRAGSYALEAAEAGMIGICWTNTIPLMPPWGSDEVRIGNNPIAIAVPGEGGPMLLDMAMSQFSQGRLQVAEREKRTLAVPGGYDGEGRLTRDPGAILQSRRPVPIGYWKGSAMSVILDAAAALLTQGLAAHEIGRDGAGERAVSQVHLAIEPPGGGAILEEIIENLHRARPIAEDEPVRYPGEGMLRARKQSLAEGVPVDEELLRAVKAS